MGTEEKAPADINALIDRAEKLIRRRHRVIHDEWNYSDTEHTVNRKLIDGVPGRLREPVPLDDVKALITEIRQVIDDVWDLAEACREHPPLMVNLRRASTNSG